MPVADLLRLGKMIRPFELADAIPVIRELRIIKSAAEIARIKHICGVANDAFDRLPDLFRTLVLLVDVEGLTYREAADVLNVPIGTVMSRLSRGRRLLRLELAEHAPDTARDRAGSPGASLNNAQGRVRS